VSKAKAKGTSFESLVVAYLVDQGWLHAERRALTGTHDKGDITGTGPLVWECKNHKTLSFSEWIEEAEVERVNASADFGVVVAKRRGRGQAGDQYAVMRLSEMVKLLKQAGY
jgi:hypothetical protein